MMAHLAAALQQCLHDLHLPVTKLVDWLMSGWRRFLQSCALDEPESKARMRAVLGCCTAEPRRAVFRDDPAYLHRHSSACLPQTGRVRCSFENKAHEGWRVTLSVRQLHLCNHRSSGSGELCEGRRGSVGICDNFRLCKAANLHASESKSHSRETWHASLRLRSEELLSSDQQQKRPEHLPSDPVPTTRSDHFQRQKRFPSTLAHPERAHASSIS